MTAAVVRSASVLGILLTTAACAPVVKRDLSAMPVGQVGFDDLCGLQTYFDKLETKEGTAPRVVHSSDIERARARAGRTRFAFETEFQLQAVRRVLDENWRRLPPGTADAPRVDIEVQWSQRGPLRRVVTEEDAELIIGSQRSALPYHACLSEFLFGAPIYRQRRDVLGLAPLPQARSLVLESNKDAGPGDADARDAGTRDRGPHETGSRDAGAPDKR